MAFKEHSEFSPPPNGDSTIWRYMDLAKFLSLIDKAALFFPRVDMLDMEDPFEGYYTSYNLTQDIFVEYDTHMPDGKKATPPDREAVFQILSDRQLLRGHVKGDRARTFVSSWHTQDHESAAMWKMYAKSGDGIAIESSYNRLVDCIANYSDFEIHIGMIKYIDYRREAIPRQNLLSPFMHKRKSFEYERELRALIWTPQNGKNTDGSDPLNNFISYMGLPVPVDLAILINRVLVAPTAPAWMLDLIKSVTTRYGLKVPIQQSDLASKPIY